MAARVPLTKLKATPSARRQSLSGSHRKGTQAQRARMMLTRMPEHKGSSGRNGSASLRMSQPYTAPAALGFGLEPFGLGSGFGL